ncbi:hypothetical protein BLOT_012918 [Blomia tropicalis]|nr:hypothetical protein BLOT_012918 [Blomia tropicalis]
MKTSDSKLMNLVLREKEKREQKNSVPMMNNCETHFGCWLISNVLLYGGHLICKQIRAMEHHFELISSFIIIRQMCK